MEGLEEVGITRPKEEVYRESFCETLNIFRNNRNLPVLPSKEDLTTKYDSFISILYNDIITNAKQNNVTPNEQELAVAEKSYVAAAVVKRHMQGLGLPNQPLEGAAEGGNSQAVQTITSHQQAPLAKILSQKDEASVALRTAASDQLSHLVFPKAIARPAAAWHPKWKLKTVISGHTGWVRCLDVDPSNEWFASAGNDRLIKIWDLASGTLKLSLTGHIFAIRGIQISDRHPYLFSCAEDNAVKCWDLEQNKVVRHYHGHLSGIYSLTLHPGLDILASGGRDSSVRLWDIRTRDAIHIFSGHKSTVFSLASQSAEPQLISGSADCTVRTWDLRQGKVANVLTHHSKSIRSLAVHPRQYSLLSAGGDGLKVWNGAQTVYDRDLDSCKSIINSAVIKDDPESAVVVAGGDNGFIHFWDWRSGKKFNTIESIPQPGSLSSENGILALKFDKSETRLITGECDKTIKIWEEDLEDTAAHDNDDQQDHRASPLASLT